MGWRLAVCRRLTWVRTRRLIGHELLGSLPRSRHSFDDRQSFRQDRGLAGEWVRSPEWKSTSDRRFVGLPRPNASNTPALLNASEGAPLPPTSPLRLRGARRDLDREVRGEGGRREGRPARECEPPSRLAVPHPLNKCGVGKPRLFFGGRATRLGSSAA